MRVRRFWQERYLGHRSNGKIPPQIEHITILCLSRPIEAEVLEYLNDDGRTEPRKDAGKMLAENKSHLQKM